MAGTGLEHLTAQDFDDQVLRKPGLWLVDFSTPWCPPCRVLTPVLSALKEPYAGRLDLAEVNLDEQEELGARFNIRSVPTMLLFRDGNLIERRVGAMAKSALTKWLDEAAG